jgi:hypothetical protein
MRNLLTEKRIMVVLGILIILAFAFSVITAVRTFNLEPGQEIRTSGGIVVAKPSNNIVDATLRDDGYLVVQFEDGTSKEVGYILGKDGSDGQAISPTQAQIALAVTEYCTSTGKCDAREPSPEQVAIAISNYCVAHSQCLGAAGVNGQNATTEQIMAAVTEYCSDGRCQGPQGAQGITGISGKDPVINCVVREEDGLDVEYIAWKYSSDDNTTYQNLYKLPTGTTGNNCIDLTPTT